MTTRRQVATSGIWCVRRWPLAASVRPLAVPVLSVGILIALAPSYSLATTILIFAMAAMGCNLLLGYAGLMSFGQGIFFGVGAYAAGLMFVERGVQVPAALVVGTLVAAATAGIIGRLCIMRQGVYFVMLTFAFASMFAAAVYIFKDVTGGENGLRGFPAMTVGAFGVEWFSLGASVTLAVFTAVCYVLVYVAFTRVTRSPFGAVLEAIRENESRALAIGYNTARFKLLAFVLSGACTGLAGGLYAVFLGAVPDTSLQVETSTVILVMTVLGGTASLSGSFLGAVAYLLLQDFLSGVWERWQIFLALALLGIVLYLRGGILGAVRATVSWVRAWRRRAA